MTDKELSGRNRLKEAMKLSDQTYLDKYPPIENEVKYSEKYLKYIDRLIKQTKSPFYKYFNTFGKRVAGIAAAMLIAFSCAMTVKAVRESVIEFFTNVYEKFVEIFFDKDDIAKAPETIETVYTLGFIPDGYEVCDVRIDENKVFWVWKNQNGDYIEFLQSTLDGSTLMDTEESNYTIFYLENTKVAYNEKYGMKTYFWNTHEYTYCLFISSDWTEDDCIKLIESITEYIC